MPIFNNLMQKILKMRMPQIEYFMRNPLEVQESVFKSLIQDSKHTIWGEYYDYKSIRNWEDFNNRLPINTYETLLPFFERIRKGEDNVLWTSDIKWFSKSSGTTSNKSKFIPISEESLQECHYKGGKDMLALYCNIYPETNIFSGANLALGGSRQANEYDNDIFIGDVSAILIDNLPLWAEMFRTPKKEIALMSEWEEKLKMMIRDVIQSNVVSLSGVPSWMLVLLRGVINETGKSIEEVWPNLEAYFHGGVSFNPYRETFNELIPKGLNYLETYNASEGFFGLQNEKDDDSLLLLLDYGIFYEFIPLEEIENLNPKIIPLSEVEMGKNYAVVISTNGGLWRYIIGDTIQFTNKFPYKFKITGRTKNFINLSGEELIIDNATKALEKATKATNSIISEYTAAPHLGEVQYHDWIIEFEKEPDNIEEFANILDKALQDENSDYEAKRYKDYVLSRLRITEAPKGTFLKWLKSKGKMGGQHKVPRLSNNRDFYEEIIKLI